MLSLISTGETPTDTKNKGIFDIIWFTHAVFEILMIISLLLRWCKIDLMLWTILLITVMLWVVPILQNKLATP